MYYDIFWTLSYMIRKVHKDVKSLIRASGAYKKYPKLICVVNGSTE